MSVWKSDETLLSICILNFSFKNDFVWEEISNIRHSVSSPDETPRSSSKILRCASYFQLSSRCFIWWWNTASHVWYITWKITQTQEGSPDLKWWWKKGQNQNPSKKTLGLPAINGPKKGSPAPPPKKKSIPDLKKFSIKNWVRITLYHLNLSFSHLVI